jgi:hypothetical protein
LEPIFVPYTLNKRIENEIEYWLKMTFLVKKIKYNGTEEITKFSMTYLGYKEFSMEKGID